MLSSDFLAQMNWIQPSLLPHSQLKMRITLIITFLFLNWAGFAQTGDNAIKGKVIVYSSSGLLINKGAEYSAGSTSLTEEKKRIDRLNAPERNIIISAHPLDFSPNLVPGEAQITQRSKTFLPNIIAITKGSTVYFLNEDEHFHNIHSLTPKARFNIGRRPPGNAYGQKINKVGIVKLGCDIHPEMGAVILSLDTPYFTKIKPDQSFQISGLPDGRYEIRVYHPAFQQHTQQITIENGTVKTLNVNLKNKA